MKNINYEDEALVAKSYLDLDAVILDNNDNFFKMTLNDEKNIIKPYINFKKEKIIDKSNSLSGNSSSKNTNNNVNMNMEVKIKNTNHKIETFKEVIESTYRLSNNCKETDTLNSLIQKYKLLQSDENSKLSIEVTTIKNEYGKLIIYPDSEVLDKNKTNKSTYESQMLEEIIDRLSSEDDDIGSIFCLKKNNKFKSNFKHFVISNNDYLMTLTAQMNTRYMELSKNQKNLSGVIIDSYALNVDIKSINETKLYYFIFYMGCYIQDLSIDITKNLLETKNLRIKKQDYEDICLMTKGHDKSEIYHFFKAFSESENNELLIVIHKKHEIIDNLISDIIIGLKSIVNLFKLSSVSLF